MNIIINSHSLSNIPFSMYSQLERTAEICDQDLGLDEFNDFVYINIEKELPANVDGYTEFPCAGVYEIYLNRYCSKPIDQVLANEFSNIKQRLV